MADVDVLLDALQTDALHCRTRPKQATSVPGTGVSPSSSLYTRVQANIKELNDTRRRQSDRISSSSWSGFLTCHN